MAATARPEPRVHTDDQLMVAIQADSVEAFSEIYDRYCSRAYRIAQAVCHDHGFAQDAVQEAFASVWKARSSYYEGRGTVAGWLLTIVRNRAIDVTRRNGAANSRRVNDVLLEGRPGPDDSSEQALHRDQASHLLALLDKLPVNQREVITLAFYGQLTHAEIAEQLSLPPGTIKGRMRLGMQKLRADLGSAEL